MESVHCLPPEMDADHEPRSDHPITERHLLAGSLLKIRELFQSQKLILNALQPLNRSFSQPELRSELVSDFKSFRDLLLEHTVRKQQNGLAPSTPKCTCSRTKPSNGQVGCDSSDNDSDQSTPPVPKPRKSVLRRRQNKDPSKQSSSSRETSSASCPSDTQPEMHAPLAPELPMRPSSSLADCARGSSPAPTLLCSSESTHCDSSGSSVPGPSPTEPSVPQLIASEQATILPSHLSQSVSTRAQTIKVKAKHSFRQFLKINKIASNKFLSIRLAKDSLSRKRSFFSWNGESAEQYKPRRPTRVPPPPPILVFRTAAPLPESDEDERVDESSVQAKSISIPLTKLGGGDNSLNFDGDDISELYHDAFNTEDIDSLYCSVDEVAAASSVPEDRVREVSKSLYQIVDQLFEEDEEQGAGYDETREEYGYYDDGECIYEELSSNDGTIYEEFIEEDNVYDNAEVVANGTATDEKKQIKRLKKVAKMMKRFHLNGDEIPVNAGIIKQDRKGSKSDLLVRKGETVLILRVEGNPPGKWLAKNERSKIGYVDLENVYFDTDSIKAVITSFRNT